jgi:hypothetical protein
VIGKLASRDVEAGTPLEWEMVDDAKATFEEAINRPGVDAIMRKMG